MLKVFVVFQVWSFDQSESFEYTFGICCRVSWALQKELHMFFPFFVNGNQNKIFTLYLWLVWIINTRCTGYFSIILSKTYFHLDILTKILSNTHFCSDTLTNTYCSSTSSGSIDSAWILSLKYYPIQILLGYSYTYKLTCNTIWAWNFDK